jgi:hypothetical protein
MMLTTPDNTRKVLTTVLVLVLSSLACMEQVVTPTPTVSPVEPTPSPLPATPTRRAVPSATAEADVQTAVVRAALVNVRAMPDGEVIGQIEAGQEVEIVECQDNWCLLVEPAGYVFQGCLSIADGQGCTAK